jgi:molecular chaperone GrpE
MEEENKKDEECCDCHCENDAECCKSEKPDVNNGELEQKCNEYLNNWKRERADFINYKNSETERIESLLNYTNERLVLRLLPVLDNFDLAEKEMPVDLKENAWAKGIMQSRAEIQKVLKDLGAEEIEAKINDDFDPNIHEAVEIGESDKIEPGKIVEIIKKGYKLNDKVIRPISVKISK